MQVEDTGIGIKEEDHSKLFKLFGFLEQNKKLNSKGIGLGLHISKKITRMFNGDIVFRSEYGKGTNFIFIVALQTEATGNSSTDLPTENTRIFNPIRMKYPKITIPRKSKISAD